MKTATNIQMAGNQDAYGAIGGFITSGLVSIACLFQGKGSAANQYKCPKTGVGCRQLSPTMAFLEW